MKVYVVWHSCYECVLGVYSTEERALKEVSQRIDEEETKGLDCSIYRALYAEFEIDAELLP